MIKSRAGRVIREPSLESTRETDGDVPLPHLLRGAVVHDSTEDQDIPYPRILRADVARVVSAPVDIYVEELEPDLPLPSVLETAEEEEVTHDPDHLRAEIDAEWHHKLEDAVLRVREEAFEAGYGRARDEMQATIDQTRADLAADGARLQTSFEAFMESVEVRAVALAVDAAEAVLGCNLPDDARLVIEQSLATAIEELAGDGAIDVNLHPVDLLRIQESGFEAQVSSAVPSVRWSPDETLEEGDWSAKSSQAVIRRIRSELVNSLRARLGVNGADFS